MPQRATATRDQFAAVRCALVSLILVSAPAASSLAADDTTATRAEGLEFFERKIRPLFVQHCYECHSAESEPLQGGLRLDRRDDLLRGGDSGPAVAPGQPEASLLITAVGYADDIVQMPPSGKLSAANVELLTEWVRRGAPMPEDPSGTVSDRPGIDFEEGRRFWSFQPVSQIAPPTPRETTWPRRRIDSFILAELERHGLVPSAEADRRTLIRRVSFDLIGLPPTPEDVEAFVNDPAPDAYERLVDRLLASPHYGERWGRYWLDLARYSDATASWLSSLAQAWLYRDWVIGALNADLPYNAFVRRQLAADQVPNAAPSDIAALGFLGLSPTYWKELKLDKEVIKGTVAEEWEERIDAVGRTFLGLTLACARCHDHKFDPISTEDYYALAGVIAGTRLIDRYLLPEPEADVVRAAHEKVSSLRAEVKTLEENKPIPAEAQTKIDEIHRQIAAIEQMTPHYNAPLAHAVDDAALYVEADGPHATKLVYRPDEPRDLHVQVRGNPSNPGPLVPRRFLTVLSAGTPERFTRGSGRLDLADAIVTDAAPLAARVIVNRVWAHHFGRGLVETPSDFGAQGAPPTHPELLDDLAARFIESGWSLKWLHREIVLSATYRQSCAVGKPKAESGKPSEGATSSVPFSAFRPPLSLDPDNRLLWRMNRRRLEVEAWRDAMLAAAGTLDRRIGGPAVELKDPANARRTVYGRVDRYELNDMLRLYDFPDPLGHSPARVPTTTPLQQLFVLNGPLLQRQAGELAERVIAAHPGDAEAQIRHAYKLLFGREATEVELRLGLEFLTGLNGTAPIAPEAWRQYAQVLLGSNELLFVD